MIDEHEDPELEAEVVLRNALMSMRNLRPAARDTVCAREWSVTITELEKVCAYFRVYVTDYIHPRE